MKQLILAVCLLNTACDSAGTSTALYVEAADAFRRQCERTGNPGWKLRASAAGIECDVLWIESKVPLDTSMIEAFHYARPTSNGNAVQLFSEAHRFRGVAYTDSNQRIWTYGAVTRDEVPALRPCH